MKLIPLTQSKFAKVDDEDYDFLMQWKWYASRKHTCYYAGRWEGSRANQQRFAMHRVLMKLIDKKLFVDHIDRDGLNNQKSNLRIATASQNMANRKSKTGSSSRFLGVSWKKANRNWCASIGKDNNHYHLGNFDSEEEAALAYNKKAIELHGEFANLNKI